MTIQTSKRLKSYVETINMQENNEFLFFKYTDIALCIYVYTFMYIKFVFCYLDYGINGI